MTIPIAVVVLCAGVLAPSVTSSAARADQGPPMQGGRVEAASEPAADDLDACLAQMTTGSRAGFLQFRQELRAALAAKDAEMTALLVDFPLRLNAPDGSRVSLLDPETLRLRFEDAFPASVRAVVLDPATPLGCFYYDEMMLGNGTVWIRVSGGAHGERFRVSGVNVPEPRRAKSATSAPRTLEFVCETATSRSIVDADRDGTPRLRTWRKPKSLTAPPDLQLTGEGASEGTGPCRHDVWRFAAEGRRYVLSEFGCGPEREPPRDAVGQLETVMLDEEGKERDDTGQTEWCF